MTENQRENDGGPEKSDRPRGVLSRFGDGRVEPHPAGGEDEPAREDASEPEARAGSGRVRVDDDGTQRPFMLGILVHSLTESGLSFEDAYAISQEVWGRVQDRKLVTKKELGELVHAIAGDTPSAEYFETHSTTHEGRLDVVGPNGRWPFNQGRLQKSLLAAGLQPRQSFEIVVDVEWELRRRGEPRVTRDAIRKLVTEILVEQIDQPTAERYRYWRKYQNEDDRPVIVLLGGTSGVGKSSLALEVARRLSIGRVLSTDSIRDVMRVMVSDELVPTLHVSSFEAHTRLVQERSDDVDPIVEGFLEQTRTVAVGVRAVIERAIAEGTSTVLDGVSLVPGILDPEEWLDRAHVFFMLAADVDRESLHGHLIARAEGPGTRSSERYVRNFQKIFRIQEDLLERAEACEVPIVDVQDLENATQQVVRHVVSGVGRRRQAEGARLD